MQRFRGGLVFKAHRLLYDSTLGLRVLKKKKKKKVSSLPGKESFPCARKDCKVDVCGLYNYLYRGLGAYAHSIVRKHFLIIYQEIDI